MMNFIILNSEEAQLPIYVDFKWMPYLRETGR